MATITEQQAIEAVVRAAPVSGKWSDNDIVRALASTAFAAGTDTAFDSGFTQSPARTGDPSGVTAWQQQVMDEHRAVVAEVMARNQQIKSTLLTALAGAAALYATGGSAAAPQVVTALIGVARSIADTLNAK